MIFSTNDCCCSPFFSKKRNQHPSSCILLSRDPIFFWGGLLVVHPSHLGRREISIRTTKPMMMQSICLTCVARFPRLGSTSHLSHLKFFVGFWLRNKRNLPRTTPLWIYGVGNFRFFFGRTNSFHRIFFKAEAGGKGGQEGSLA